MNEQLIQELAVQIDGQVAQSCGSYDPNVKGNYIFQKYPQVRACANYTEAIYLLAKEQAALQMPQNFGNQPTGFGQTPQGGFGQPVQGGFGQPVQGGYGQPVQGGPQQGVGQPQGGLGQTPSGFGQPNGFGQPHGGLGANQGGFGQGPAPGIFGSPAIPQTGQQGASQFTAFQAQNAPARSDKVFGFIPVKAIVVLAILLVITIVIGGIGISVKNAFNPKSPSTQTEQGVEEETTDDLFD